MTSGEETIDPAAGGPGPPHAPAAQRASAGPAAQAGTPGADEPNGWWVGPAGDPDRYELLGTGLSGGEGTTYQARYHGESGQPLTVAVKQLRRPAGQSPAWPRPDDWARWRDQIQIIAQVSNSHLVQVRTLFAGAPPHHRGTQPAAGAGAEFGVPYLVMDWVAGPTLDRKIRSSPRTIGLRLRIAWIAQLADAISALHSATRTAGNPLVHRDIKPGNCIIGPGGQLVLIDIGTMRRAGSQPDPLGMYSAHYTAPEVLADLSAPRQAASDLFALGGVAYFCLTGSDPPAAADLDERSVRSALAVPRRWRRRLARHLLPLLSPDPAARAQVPARAWAARLQKITTRRRWPAVVAACAAALGALVTIPYATGLVTVAPVLQAPAGRSQALTGMQPFGEQYQRFAFTVRGTTIMISPPASYDHMWGGFLPGTRCATTIDFDMKPAARPALPAFGLAIAPRAQLSQGQPQGASIQYEYETAALTKKPGSYVRPAALPGGAWSIAVAPRQAPDVHRAHHVRVYAEGSSMAIDIDGQQTAQYTLPGAECGGVAVRAWGAAFTLSKVSVRGN